ncbi:hypothetical protein DFH08DRAFT_1008026 [Mycena albidolilacea]|uniref:Transmembrane protein n=1 Tax=Mycena albidolilacea TaxID=1033008 RepID=A0AAD6ZYN0_9AGAR|nr:hypothetical protein DFH08DRAFT_1008026 [Mycena albidolilacea]
MSHVDHTFPNHGLRFLSASVHFLGVTVITYFLSRRSSAENLTSREAWRHISWPRLCLLLILLDSYLFILSAGLLIFGVGMRRDEHACSAGIYLCVVFYTSSKVLIYAFLTEKVYIVWENGVRRRLRSPVYLICMGTVVLYAAVILAMFFGRIAEFRSGDGACVIGLKPTASLPLLAYDLYINVLLTSLFLWPLLRLKNVNPRLRRVATPNLISASMAALGTSTVNIAILTILHGRELGWLCLGSCGLDVVLNAAALFWVTSGRPTSSSSEPNSPVGQRQMTPETSARPGAPVSRQSQLKPFHLRSSSGGARAPAPFQIHVSTTSEVETSPPVRHAELEPESPTGASYDKPKSKLSLGVTNANERLVVDETQRHSEADSQKTLDG